MEEITQTNTMRRRTYEEDLDEMKRAGEYCGTCHTHPCLVDSGRMCCHYAVIGWKCSCPDRGSDQIVAIPLLDIEEESEDIATHFIIENIEFEVTNEALDTPPCKAAMVED